MKIYPIFLKRTTTIIGGAINFFLTVKPATKITTVLRFVFQSIKPAIRITFSAIIAKMTQRPATNLVQSSLDLISTTYVITGTNDAGATQNWTNPTNVQGAPDGVLASFNGAALLLAAGVLRGAMTSFATKPASLIIDEVYLDFYGSVTGLPVVSDLISRLNLRYRVNTSPTPGLETTLESVTTGASSFLSTPKSYRINRTGADSGKFTDGATAALSTDVTWANLALVQPNWDAAVILGLVAAQYRADAVKLRIVAHETTAL